MWIIRNAKEKDLETILEIEESSYADPWTLEMFRSDLSFSFAHLWTATESEEGPVVGYVSFWLVEEEIHFLNLAVKSRSRRKGLGQKLVRRAMEWASKKGAKAAFLEVRESNCVARPLYEKLGFVIDHRRRNYYRKPREDALVMVLRNLEPSTPAFSIGSIR